VSPRQTSEDSIKQKKGYVMLKKTLGLLASAAMVLGATQMASAADLAPSYTKAPVPVEVWNWTGFYIGGHVGAGWGTTESSLDSIAAGGAAIPVGLALTQNSPSGFLGGGQIGYNFQSGWAVFGVQADIAGLDVKGTTPCLVVLSCTSDTNWLATVSGRVGAVVADKTLVYVKGGAAWLNSTNSFTVPAGLGLGAIGGSADSTSLGWLLGFGAEYAFTRNWSAFIEYDYMDFEKKDVSFVSTGPLGATANTTIQNKLSIAKVGVNYKF
jgi:outer membrane immunogenic protein